MSIKFHLPDFCGNYKMNLYLADTLNEHPEYFYDDIKIASSYGCFPPAAWNGGRTVTGAVRREFIDFIIQFKGYSHKIYLYKSSYKGDTSYRPILQHDYENCGKRS